MKIKETNWMRRCVQTVGLCCMYIHWNTPSTDISRLMADSHSAHSSSSCISFSWLQSQSSHLVAAPTACLSWRTIQLGLLLPKRGCTRSRGCCRAQSLHTAEELCILETGDVKSTLVPPDRDRLNSFTQVYINVATTTTGPIWNVTA